MLRKLAAMGAVVALLAGLAVGAESGGAADHIDAPLARADLALDIGDIFVQQAPEDADDILIVVTANPAQVPGERRPWATREEGEYRVNIDRDGDAKRDDRITVNFGSVRDDGSQQVKVRMGRRTLGEGVTGETIELRGGGRAYADVFDDPFFIDFQAVLDDLEAMGGPRRFCDGNEVDFLAGLNTGAIVIQIPSRELLRGRHHRESTMGLWVETFDRRLDRIIDRMGQPEVPTFFIEDDEPGLVTGLGTRDKYNGAKPRNDVANFGDQVAERLIEFSSRDDSPYTDDQAVEVVTGDILPDILRFDAASGGGIFDGNGRKLLDDGLDFALNRATGGALGGSAADPTDCIDTNDRDLSTTFPYLAAAHEPIPDESFVGAVYVQTNALDGNEVAAYGRNADGTLTPIGNFATSGAGSTEFDGGEGLDPLISADSLIVTEDERFLLTVNAGSDTITAFAINSDFTLTKTSEVSSGGVGPNSLAYRDGRVYVTNIDRDGVAFGDPNAPRAEPNDQGSVVGFRLSDRGRLQPVPTAIAELDNRPANIGFSADGRRLIVTAITSGAAALPGENAQASVYVFHVGQEGRLELADTGTSTERDNVEGRNLPSAIDFDSVVLDGNEYVVVTEAREFNSDGAPPAFSALQAGSVSVYALGRDSSLTLTEGDFALSDPAVENVFGANGQQLTACWIDFGHDGSTFYVSNAITATISSLQLQADGTVTVLDTVAAAGTSAFAEPGVPVDGPTGFGRTDGFIDLDVSPGGEYLYQLEGLSGNVGVYAVGPDGSLDLIQEVTGTLPDIDTQGIISIGR